MKKKKKTHFHNVIMYLNVTVISTVNRTTHVLGQAGIEFFFLIGTAT